MRWRNHILDSDNSMANSLNKRLGALLKIQKTASFPTRKMIGTGIFMSKLIYLMPLWAGCEDYLVTALQVIHHQAQLLHSYQDYSEDMPVDVSQKADDLPQLSSALQDPEAQDTRAPA